MMSLSNRAQQVTSALARLQFELPFCRALDGAGVFTRTAVFSQLGRRGCSQAACRNTPGCRFPDGVLCASVGCGHSLQYGNQRTLKGKLWRLLPTGRVAMPGASDTGWSGHALSLESFFHSPLAGTTEEKLLLTTEWGTVSPHKPH
jgi:hypothetical protein